MKKEFLVCLMLLFCVFQVGMGGLGGSMPISVPEPTINYAATITDQSDVSTRVEKISFDGQTAVSGRLGSGRISIGFDKIASIHFVLRDRTLEAEVLLKDGEKVAMVVDKGVVCYGKLPYGELEVTMEDVRTIAMHGQVSREVTVGK